MNRMLHCAFALDHTLIDIKNLFHDIANDAMDCYLVIRCCVECPFNELRQLLLAPEIITTSDFLGRMKPDVAGFLLGPWPFCAITYSGSPIFRLPFGEKNRPMYSIKVSESIIALGVRCLVHDVNVRSLTL